MLNFSANFICNHAKNEQVMNDFLAIDTNSLGYFNIDNN